MTTPIPTTPGAIIGYGRRGPIRVQAGGSETAPEGGQPTPPTAPTAPSPTAPPVSPPVPQPPTWMPPAPTAPADDAEDLAKLPQKWQKHIRDLRDESAKYRTTARSETVLRHAYTTATAHGVNPDALLGSVAFSDRARTLDPNAEDFPTRLAEVIQAVLQANPWMAAQQAATAPPAPQAPPVPPSSGGDFGGGNGGGTPPKTIHEQIREAEGKGDWATARRLKAAQLHQLSLTTE
ncbi:hypothetical protein ACFYY8_06300 [Streptosporangium sp. NPDC001559]|uniref:hypothetical protein n=1 Tax=Streptosporangium sp. NPDC001559 TaxID=3366187 RepID=UPI0036F079FB